MKLIIQIPCYNEEETLPATLADLPREVPGFDKVEWLVIDDGSADRTSEVARELGVDHVVRVPQNRGLANAFLTGLDSALRAGADVIVNTDADNQYDGSCIPDLVAPIVEGRADLVIGERPIEAVDDFSPVKKRLQRAGSAVVRTFSGTDVGDAASGFRAFSRDTAIKTQVFGKYSYTMETIVQAGWEGMTIVGVPIKVNPKTRESRLVKSIPRYIWRSGTTIVRSFALYKPMRFFFFLGLAPFLVGLALVLRWFYLHYFTDDLASRVPSLVGAAVFMLLATQIWIFGLLADLLSANRRIISATKVSLRRRELDESPG
ncbi:MAG TPA: glycosyltransferase family 2 protein [Microthrixaceae bacterium]|nr:glycosyltransferase family 2 protein [Microthrixaceae bacterium]